jgi:hypothetical protein
MEECHLEEGGHRDEGCGSGRGCRLKRGTPPPSSMKTPLAEKQRPRFDEGEP